MKTDTLFRFSVPNTHCVRRIRIDSLSIYHKGTNRVTINLNIALSSTPRSCKWSISFTFPNQSPVFGTLDNGQSPDPPSSSAHSGRTVWWNGTALDLEDSWFESRPCHWLSYFRLFVILFSPYGKMFMMNLVKPQPLQLTRLPIHNTWIIPWWLATEQALLTAS